MQKGNRCIPLFKMNGWYDVSAKERQWCQKLAFIRRDYDENGLIYKSFLRAHGGVWQTVRFSWAVRKERTSRTRFRLSDKSGGPSHHNSCSKRSKKTRNGYMSGDYTAATKKKWYWDQLNSAVL